MFDKAKLEITPAGFQVALELKRALGNALNERPIQLDGLNINLEDLTGTEVTSEMMGALLRPVLSVVNSREVETCLFECAKNRSLYNKKKIDMDFFEQVENRELYFPIMFEIARVNIGPFFAGLFSGLKGAKGKLTGILKS